LTIEVAERALNRAITTHNAGLPAREEDAERAGYSAS
jgi:hypothetical protein